MLEWEIKDLARRMGASLVGIGSVDRFQDAPEMNHPAYLLEGAQSVVSFAVARTYGEALCVRGRRTKFPYQYGRHLTNRQLSIISHRIANVLERVGYVSMMTPTHVSGTAPERPPFTGLFSQRHAAVAAGLGDLGWNNLFLSPQFGPRQRLGSLITTAPLRPDPLIEERLCDECMVCVRRCPPGALKEETGPTIMIGHKEITVGQYDKPRCGLAAGGRMGVWCDEEPGEQSRVPSHALISGDGVEWCAYCMLFCPVGDL